MASFVFTGTATNHFDLLDKVIAHLTGVGMGSQAWELLKTEAIGTRQYRYLRGPGLTNTDNIYINVSVDEALGSDIFSWHTRGAIAYNPLNTWDAQPGSSLTSVTPLWDSVMPYWLVANGRRFILIVKVSTTYQSLYAGFYLPYATSAEMPYPIVVMGNCGSTLRWSEGTYRIGGFWDPVEGSSKLRFWDGAWISIQNYYSRTDARSELGSNVVWPFQSNYGFGRQRDGSYFLMPAILHGDYSAVNIYGELDGVFQVSGFSIASEDIVTVDSVNYLVVQSVYRTTTRDYAAIRLG